MSHRTLAKCTTNRCYLITIQLCLHNYRVGQKFTAQKPLQINNYRQKQLRMYSDSSKGYSAIDINFWLTLYLKITRNCTSDGQKENIRASCKSNKLHNLMGSSAAWFYEGQLRPQRNSTINTLLHSFAFQRAKNLIFQTECQMSKTGTHFTIFSTHLSNVSSNWRQFIKIVTSEHQKMNLGFIQGT